jgi:RNA polymerase sigma-70 factor (ECF subfamily)
MSSGRALQALADEELMELVRAGQSRAFEIVFDRHVDAAFSLAYRMCGSRSRAEDVTQEAFLSAWRGGRSYDPSRGSVRSWLLSTVRNRAIDAFRVDAIKTSRDVDDEHLGEWMPSPHLTDLEAVRRDEAEHVRSAVEELPAEQRRVIELAYFSGFTHTEIAQMLDLPTGTVKGRMRLGLSKLRVALDSVEMAA